jgi:hypothetical protein
MPYPSDARNHYKAIDSEINLSEYNSEIEFIFGKKVKKYLHLGGTKNKTDVKIIFSDESTEKITLKSKKNIKVGSFDWVNTTNFCKNEFNNSFDIFNKYKGSNDVKHKKILENAIKNELQNITSDTLTEIFLNEVYETHLKDNLKILIIDEKTKTLTHINPKIFDLIKKKFKLKIHMGKGKTSCKVLCENGEGVQIDLGLRVRVHLNNGWTKWHKGESSVLCLKFQQDKVYKMINK